MGIRRRCAAALAAVVLCGGPFASTTAASAAPSQVKVLSWNTCANAPTTTHCSHAGKTGAVARDISATIDKHPGLNVVLLQEVCSVDVTGLAKLRPGWSFHFVPIRARHHSSAGLGSYYDVGCHPESGTSRGQFGIAVGVDQKSATFHSWYYNYAPYRSGWGRFGVTQPLLCATVPAYDATFCGTHLTPVPSKELRDKLPGEGREASYFWNIQDHQARGILQHAGTRGRVVVGGDLNIAPPDTASGGAANPNATAPLYAGYRECDQSAHGDKRTGAGTYQWASGEGTTKLDYVFASRGATVGCYVTDVHVATSDHRSITATVTF